MTALPSPSSPSQTRRQWLALACTALASGCNDGGGGGPPDIGDNRKGVVLALGDSITNGYCVPDGAPYPSRVAALRGQTVINEGVCAQTAEEGSARVGNLLKKHKPATLLVLYGANDIIQGDDPATTIASLRNIIGAAKANKTRVLLANLLPMFYDHAPFGPGVAALNPQINALAKAEGVRLINLAGEFGQRIELLQEDGLHPTSQGTQIIAASFADAL